MVPCVPKRDRSYDHVDIRSVDWGEINNLVFMTSFPKSVLNGGRKRTTAGCKRYFLLRLSRVYTPCCSSVLTKL